MAITSANPANIDYATGGEEEEVAQYATLSQMASDKALDPLNPEVIAIIDFLRTYQGDDKLQTEVKALFDARFDERQAEISSVVAAIEKFKSENEEEYNRLLTQYRAFIADTNLNIERLTSVRRMLKAGELCLNFQGCQEYLKSQDSEDTNLTDYLQFVSKLPEEFNFQQVPNTQVLGQLLFETKEALLNGTAVGLNDNGGSTRTIVRGKISTKYESNYPSLTTFSRRGGFTLDESKLESLFIRDETPTDKFSYACYHLARELGASYYIARYNADLLNDGEVAAMEFAGISNDPSRSNSDRNTSANLPNLFGKFSDDVSILTQLGPDGSLADFLYVARSGIDILPFEDTIIALDADSDGTQEVTAVSGYEAFVQTIINQDSIGDDSGFQDFVSSYRDTISKSLTVVNGEFQIDQTQTGVYTSGGCSPENVAIAAYESLATLFNDLTTEAQFGSVGENNFYKWSALAVIADAAETDSGSQDLFDTLLIVLKNYCKAYAAGTDSVIRDSINFDESGDAPERNGTTTRSLRAQLDITNGTSDDWRTAVEGAGLYDVSFSTAALSASAVLIFNDLIFQKTLVADEVVFDIKEIQDFAYLVIPKILDTMATFLEKIFNICGGDSALTDEYSSGVSSTKAIAVNSGGTDQGKLPKYLNVFCSDPSDGSGSWYSGTTRNRGLAWDGISYLMLTALSNAAGSILSQVELIKVETDDGDSVIAPAIRTTNYIDGLFYSTILGDPWLYWLGAEYSINNLNSTAAEEIWLDADVVTSEYYDRYQDSPELFPQFLNDARERINPVSLEDNRIRRMLEYLRSQSKYMRSYAGTLNTSLNSAVSADLSTTGERETQADIIQSLYNSGEAGASAIENISIYQESLLRRSVSRLSGDASAEYIPINDIISENTYRNLDLLLNENEDLLKSSGKIIAIGCPAGSLAAIQNPPWVIGEAVTQVERGDFINVNIYMKYIPDERIVFNPVTLTFDKYLYVSSVNPETTNVTRQTYRTIKRVISAGESIGTLNENNIDDTYTFPGDGSVTFLTGENRGDARYAGFSSGEVKSIHRNAYRSYMFAQYYKLLLGLDFEESGFPASDDILTLRVDDDAAQAAETMAAIEAETGSSYSVDNFQIDSVFKAAGDVISVNDYLVENSDLVESGEFTAADEEVIAAFRNAMSSRLFSGDSMRSNILSAKIFDRIFLAHVEPTRFTVKSIILSDGTTTAATQGATTGDNASVLNTSLGVNILAGGDNGFVYLNSEKALPLFQFFATIETVSESASTDSSSTEYATAEEGSAGSGGSGSSSSEESGEGELTTTTDLYEGSPAEEDTESSSSTPEDAPSYEGSRDEAAAAVQEALGTLGVEENDEGVDNSYEEVATMVVDVIDNTGTYYGSATVDDDAETGRSIEGGAAQYGIQQVGP